MFNGYQDGEYSLCIILGIQVIEGKNAVSLVRDHLFRVQIQLFRKFNFHVQIWTRFLLFAHIFKMKFLNFKKSVYQKLLVLHYRTDYFTFVSLYSSSGI
jgi:hypothetical protein